MKLFKTTNTDIVKYCQDLFGFKLPGESIAYRTKKCIVKFQVSSYV